MKNRVLICFTVLQIIILLLILLPNSVYSEVSSKIRIEIDGKALKTDVDPTIVQGRTLIPIRSIIEDLKGKINWDGVNKKVTIQYNDKNIELKIDSNIAAVNGKQVELDVPAMIVNKRTMIPLRFIAENFGFFVEWNDSERLVSIDTINKGILKSIDIKKSKETDIININFDSCKKYNTFVQNDQKGIIINFEGTKAVETVKTNNKKITDCNYVNNLKCLQFDRNTAQVSLETSDKEKIRIEEKVGGLIVYFEKYLEPPKGSVSFSTKDGVGNLLLNNIWLYEGEKSDSKKLYSIDKSSDGKQLTLSFDQKLSNNLENVSIDSKDGIVDKINVENDNLLKKTKIVIVSTKKIDLIDNSNGESKNSKFSLKLVDENVPDGFLKVNCTMENGNSYIKVSGGDYSVYNAFRLTDPERIVIDIPNAKVKDNYNENVVNNGMVSKIRYSQFEKDKARVVIDTINQYEYYIEYKDGVLVIEVHKAAYKNIRYYNYDGRKFVIDGIKLSEGENCKTKYDSETKYYTLTFAKTLGSYGTGWLKIFDGKVDYLRVEESAAENSISIKISDEFTFEIVPDNEKNNTTIRLVPNNKNEFANNLVFIDPGHGGTESGATYDGVIEKDLNLDVSMRLNKLLNLNGIATKMSRNSDATVGLSDRPNMANSLNATLFVSIHHNAYYESSNGTETLYNNDKGDYGVGFFGSDFAKIIQNKLVTYVGLTDRGIVDRPNLAVLKGAKMPSILAEIGFITNKTDREKILNDTFKQSAAQGLCDGIIDALRKLKQLLK